MPPNLVGIIPNFGGKFKQKGLVMTHFLRCFGDKQRLFNKLYHCDAYYRSDRLKIFFYVDKNYAILSLRDFFHQVCAYYLHNDPDSASSINAPKVCISYGGLHQTNRLILARLDSESRSAISSR